MGLMSFIKEAGEKLFGKKPEVVAAAAEPSSQDKLAAANAVASKAIGDYIRTQNLPADALTIAFDGASQIVTVSGTVATQEIKEKILLCCGNVEGVVGVNDEIVSTEPADLSQYHTVVRGDTLSAIAKKFYGNANAYPKIFEANKPMLTHPDKIYPGQVLRIPPQA
ncbi:peptidoglycan-binding protein LysM [Pseudorhodoferax sp.]|uniref:peptidoglycan-binding protein LysM n=1 Tax=Pseudorhodoferax sp. TaxID=1993553 RepID=UPI002DD6A5A2|nr:peptidoglycan-binding protein LysM [Pseudorhodoferax sp.]